MQLSRKCQMLFSLGFTEGFSLGLHPGTSSQHHKRPGQGLNQGLQLTAATSLNLG